MRLKKTKILKKIKQSILNYKFVIIVNLRDDSIGNVNSLKKLLLCNNILLTRLKSSFFKKKLMPGPNKIKLKKISGNLFLLLCNNFPSFSIFKTVFQNNLLFCSGWYNTFFIDMPRFNTILNYETRDTVVHNMLNSVNSTRLCINFNVFFILKKLLFLLKTTRQLVGIS